LDLGARKITCCEVVQGGEVVGRSTVGKVQSLMRLLGPNTPPARVAFEACREGWHVAEQLARWGHEPVMVDTTRVKQLGIGQHQRKTDRIDAETLARALAEGRLPVAHVLAPHRQALRFQLSVRRTLVETRAAYVAQIRELVRAHGEELPGCTTEQFGTRLRQAPLSEKVRALVTPLAALLEPLEQQLALTEQKLLQLCDEEPAVSLLATACGVGVIVAAAFVSVIDTPQRFRRGGEVAAYLGLVPSERTSGKRRLGAITKQGNSYLRALLLEGAWTIVRRRHPDPLSLWAQAVAQRRGSLVAAVATARRLAVILWAMWRDGTVYDPKQLAVEGARGLQQQATRQEVRAVALQRAASKLSKRRRQAERAAAPTTMMPR
jgi:transposase